MKAANAEWYIAVYKNGVSLDMFCGLKSGIIAHLHELTSSFSQKIGVSTIEID